MSQNESALKDLKIQKTYKYPVVNLSIAKFATKQ